MACFNPHPISRPGATKKVMDRITEVVFQSSPDLTTGCNEDLVPLSSRRPSFNPHPISRPGATRISPTSEAVSTCFNPHPISRPGATMEPKAYSYCVIVSILTRSHDRVQPQAPSQSHRFPDGFNPHPISRPGATLGLPCGAGRANRVSILTRSHDRVQHRVPCLRRRPPRCFNPHPISRPGATSASVPNCAIGLLFQSSPDLTTGCNSHSVQRPVRLS